MLVSELRWRYVLLLACITAVWGCASEQRQKNVPPVVRQADSDVIELLLRHRSTSRALSRIGAAMVDTLRAALPSRAIGQLNQPFLARSEIAVFVVNAVSLREDAAACGQATNDFDIPVKQRVICNKARAVSWNCAVLGDRTVACDARLLWRLKRYAFVSALATLRQNGQPVFDRNRLRNQFLTPDFDYLSTDGMEQKSEEMEAVITSAKLSNEFGTLQFGFVQFMLSHEAGHLAAGDGRGQAVPCAQEIVANQRPIKLDSLADVRARVCAPVETIEDRADAFALQFLATRVTSDTLNPANTASELFIEEFERRTRLAMRDLGLDPATWDPAKSDQETRDLYTVVWLVRLSGGGHPNDIKRFTALLEIVLAKRPRAAHAAAVVATGKQFQDAVTVLCQKLK